MFVVIGKLTKNEIKLIVKICFKYEPVILSLKSMILKVMRKEY